MEFFNTALALIVPGIGACFVWLLGIARKDPDLFHEIDKVVGRWIGKVLVIVLLSAAVNFFMYPDRDDRAALVFLVAVIVYSLLQLRSSLSFLRRVSQIGVRGDQ